MARFEAIFYLLSTEQYGPAYSLAGNLTMAAFTRPPVSSGTWLPAARPQRIPTYSHSLSPALPRAATPGSAYPVTQLASSRPVYSHSCLSQHCPLFTFPLSPFRAAHIGAKIGCHFDHDGRNPINTMVLPTSCTEAVTATTLRGENHSISL